MKKLLFLSAILITAATAAHAGVRVGFGFGLPLPALPLPGVVLHEQYAPAPVVYAQPEYCAPAPRVVYEPAPCAPVVVAPACPPVYVERRVYTHRYAYEPRIGYRYYGRGYGYRR